LLRNNSFIGQKVYAVIDSFDIDTLTYTGRTYRDAPEIDNEVIITVEEESSAIKPGDFVSVQIEDASEYELYGKFEV